MVNFELLCESAPVPGDSGTPPPHFTAPVAEIAQLNRIRRPALHTTGSYNLERQRVLRQGRQLFGRRQHSTARPAHFELPLWVCRVPRPGRTYRAADPMDADAVRCPFVGTLKLPHWTLCLGTGSDQMISRTLYFQEFAMTQKPKATTFIKTPL